jgi:hypothetical protein
VQALAKALPVNLGLWQLKLERNTFKNEGALALVDAARADEQLLQLRVDHNRGARARRPPRLGSPSVRSTCSMRQASTARRSRRSTRSRPR